MIPAESEPGTIHGPKIEEPTTEEIVEAKAVEATAKLREEDYQLAYAVDILKGLATMDFSADKVTADAKPANTGEGSGQKAKTE